MSVQTFDTFPAQIDPAPIKAKAAALTKEYRAKLAAKPDYSGIHERDVENREKERHYHIKKEFLAAFDKETAAWRHSDNPKDKMAATKWFAEEAVPAMNGVAPPSPPAKPDPMALRMIDEFKIAPGVLEAWRDRSNPRHNIVTKEMDRLYKQAYPPDVFPGEQFGALGFPGNQPTDS